MIRCPSGAQYASAFSPPFVSCRISPRCAGDCAVGDCPCAVATRRMYSKCRCKPLSYPMFWRMFWPGASVLSRKLIEEDAQWGGPPGPQPTPPSASVLSLLEEPDQGVRRGRGRPPHYEICPEPWEQETSRLCAI